MLGQAQDKSIDVVEACADDYSESAYYVACHLHPAEELQTFRATGINAKDAVLNTWNDSKRKWVIFKDAQPVVLFGVVDAGNGIGIPWMVGTPEMAKIKIFLCKISARYIEKMKKEFTSLVNYVEVNNKLSIGWARWCGFTICPPIPYGPFGYLFHPFEMGV